jgi:hypothetical protein
MILTSVFQPAVADVVVNSDNAEVVLRFGGTHRDAVSLALSVEEVNQLLAKLETGLQVLEKDASLPFGASPEQLSLP